MIAPYDHEALWSKAKVFLNRAMDLDPGRSFDEQARWASAALELLGKVPRADRETSLPGLGECTHDTGILARPSCGHGSDDDGTGPRSSWQAGAGLISMRERAAELGGSCEAGPGADGGGRVTASLPLGHPAAGLTPQ